MQIKIQKLLIGKQKRNIRTKKLCFGKCPRVKFLFSKEEKMNNIYDEDTGEKLKKPENYKCPFYSKVTDLQ